jgi:hypothetical protein
VRAVIVDARSDIAARGKEAYRPNRKGGTP